MGLRKGYAMSQNIKIRYQFYKVDQSRKRRIFVEIEERNLGIERIAGQ